MKYSKILLPLLVLSVSSTLFATQNAETLFDNKCSMCHIKTMPEDMSSLIAPPAMGVMRHVKMNYPTKEAAVSFMVDYVRNPSKDKAICMPFKIKKFGLMPSQKDNITKEELEQVSIWMYDNFPPANFQGGMRRTKMK